MTTGKPAFSNPPQLMGSHRRLTTLQQQRRDRLYDAAYHLATEGGYVAVTMRDVAAQADVGLATVYRYFHSKDHLITEINARQSMAIIEELAENPPPGETPEERLIFVFHRMLDSTTENINLASAGVQAMISDDPSTNSPDYWQQMIMVPYIKAALGNDYPIDLRELGEILGHIFFSLMIGLSSQRLPLSHCKDVISRSVELLLQDEGPSTTSS